MNSHNGHPSWPEDVGIIDIEIYFPSYYVDQEELEVYDNVSKGKYTIGLGQNRMGFCSDREDINSLCLTVVEQLMQKRGLSYSQIGRLEVGTETIIDKSKSVKTVLMELFKESGNHDVEGVDSTNACYGGTAALFNSVAWVESSAWDGRYALVVAGDIAVYAEGNARPTGGAGAVAMLIGPNAPIILERGLRSTYMEHVYDFYKPNLMSEYPTVDGKLSVQSYAKALDKCYEGFCRKAEKFYKSKGCNVQDRRKKDKMGFTLKDLDAMLFHTPYCKLVQKVWSLSFNDFIRDPDPDMNNEYRGLEAYRNLKLEETYFNKEVEKAFVDHSKSIFEKKTKPSLLIAKEVGNMYTPSLYACLVSFIASQKIEDLKAIRVGMFSYGSGLAATLFSLRFTDDIMKGSQLRYLHDSLQNIKSRLVNRRKISPEKFTEILKLRNATHHQAPYTPVGKVEDLFPKTWYLDRVDEKHRRSYLQTKEAPCIKRNGCFPKISANLHCESTRVGEDFCKISATPISITEGLQLV
ncbi:hydroxymethylglutaryl-CoA synthase 1-like isoform X1 [Stegodyphus dumicola]|uniref:hydroxymethylglutaryl-CoA synthase 1-like isoform X1 n=1 Tax=Stegodyphus dumicola TaxID=202533 RepID=UPI0015AD9E1F|nr:hydroxymethylglutaryl-CoA synthase 1-like isoform X1 [Stegodyphus dumicola]XP_035218118.1 hydroxymethylglutaryl-CoA synthase 1-like isoform X1 [Stegodyphus dumicola]XP_035218120.1 hydroxymethylglutaryl-CoA synthase 1-like isoform X1 [Stegodyphus dumicola]